MMNCISTILSTSLAVVLLTSSLLAQNHMYSPTLSSGESQEIQSGELIMREVKTQYGDGLCMETIGIMEASGETIFQVLTDYPSYPEFMSTVDSVEILASKEGLVTMNYILKPILGVSKRYRLEMVSDSLDLNVWRVSWKQVEWAGLTELETIADTWGSWLIIQQSKSHCLVHYSVYSDPGGVPFGLGSIVDAIGKRSMEKAYRETRQRVELSP